MYTILEARVRLEDGQLVVVKKDTDALGLPMYIVVFDIITYRVSWNGDIEYMSAGQQRYLEVSDLATRHIVTNLVSNALQVLISSAGTRQ